MRVPTMLSRPGQFYDGWPQMLPSSEQFYDGVPPNIAQLPKDFKTQPDDELIDMSDWGQSLKFSFRSRPPPHHLLFVTHGRVVVVLLGMLN